MDERDPIEEQLRSASESVRRVTPDAGDRFGGVRSLAHRRAVRMRTAGAVAVIAVVLSGVAVVAQIDSDDETPLAATGAKTDATYDKSTTTTVKPLETTTSSTTKTTVESVVKPDSEQPQKTTTTTGEVPKTTVPPLPKTTTTTAVKPGSRPPDAYVGTKEGGKVQAVEGSSCWKGAEDQAALCADVGAGWADDAPILQITTNALAYVWWDTQDLPKAHKGYISVRKDGETDSAMQEVACEGTNPCKMTLQLAPGEYVLMVSSYWAQGDVTHGVRLLVQ